MSLLFLLALYGSVNHEVGEVNVAFGFFRLQHTDWTTARVKTNWWLQTTSWRGHLPLKNCSRPLLLFSAAMRWWHTADLVEVIMPVNQTRRVSVSESDIQETQWHCLDRLAGRQLWQTQVWLICCTPPPPLSRASHCICDSISVKCDVLKEINGVVRFSFICSLLWFAKTTKAKSTVLVLHLNLHWIWLTFLLSGANESPQHFKHMQIKKILMMENLFFPYTSIVFQTPLQTHRWGTPLHWVTRSLGMGIVMHFEPIPPSCCHNTHESTKCVYICCWR